MKGSPTRITAILQSYHDGDLTWPEARLELLAYPYAKGTDDYPDLASNGWSSDEYGTWDEVVKGYCEGLIGPSEMTDLLTGLQAQADAAATDRITEP